MWKSVDILAVIGIILLVVFFLQSAEPQPNLQDYANFKPDQLIQMRFIVYKGYTIHSNDRTIMANYIRNESFFTFSSNWNVFVFDNIDGDSYYTTAAFKKESSQKYYRDYDYQGKGMNIIVIEANNTKPGQLTALSQKELTASATKISKDVTIKQFQTISESVDEVAERTDDLKDYSIALQQIIFDRLGEKWDVFTQVRARYFGVAYTSPYNQWIEYNVDTVTQRSFSVYVWRNYIS